MSSSDGSATPSLGYGSDDELMGDTMDTKSPISAEKRIFVNRAVNLQKIQYYGFDMDYTLCEYISPDFDILAFSLAKQFMVDSLNYPQQILDLEYNPRFPTRGLWYDRVEGNLIKVDQFGKILICCHGFRLIQGQELRGMYPNKVQRKDAERVYVMNTLFNLAETHLIASLTHFMDNRSDAEVVAGGWKVGPDKVTYDQLFQDLREAIENLHEERILKIKTVENLHKYVKKDARLPQFLARIRESGRKTFLLTNSDWWYTQHIMRYLLGDKDNDSWMSYFDLSIVDARKPKFFDAGTKFQYIDTNTGSKIGVEGGERPAGPLVYSGGNHETITRLLGAAGPDVIYCGDHLHADVVKCRKLCEWRTLLIVPELEHEVNITREVGGLLPELVDLEAGLVSAEDEAEARSRIWHGIKKLDGSFGHTGSVFRAGTRLSYFGSNVLFWADLYTGSVNNLGEYSLSWRFGAPHLTLPHETMLIQQS